MLLLQLYFLFHLTFSERSIPSLIHLSAENEILDTKLASIDAERQKLEDRVIRMRPETLDPDLLTEQTLYMLGKAKGNSIALSDQNG